MEHIGYLILFFAVWFGMLFYFVRSSVREHKARAGVRNTDMFSRTHYYVLDYDLQEAVRRLAMRNAGDLIDYSFDEERYVITFRRMAERAGYQLLFYPVGTYTYLAVRLVRDPTGKAYFLNRLDRFFVEKLDATRVDRDHFSALVGDVTPQSRSIP